jgi:phosphoribosyl 1,2-cyclic phosphodiesterase
MLNITFYGVRGSTPCCCESTRGFGGNTACVLVEVEGNDHPIICDLGTGLRYLGNDIEARRNGNGAPDGGTAFRGAALVSHLHWDHIQGLPFFRPILTPDAALHLFGPPQDGSTLRAELAHSIQPPVFPVGIEDLPVDLAVHEVASDTFSVGGATVTSFPVPHIGPTNGYRIDAGGASMAFICDHQQPVDGSLEVPAHIVEACAGVDVLVHDSQYDWQEFDVKRNWGHCTPDFALALAERCGAERLVLFHHDPSHDDGWIRDQVCRVQAMAGSRVEVIGAAEGLTLRSQ